MHLPRDSALHACIEATLAAGGRPLSLHDLGLATGVSARMLVHHFGSKAKLDRAIVEAIEHRMRENATAMLARGGGALDADAIMQSFREPEQLATRTLFRTMLARALAGDANAVAAMQVEREHWLTLFGSVLGDPASAQRMLALVLGATLDAIFVDIAEGQGAALDPLGPQAPDPI